MEEKKVKKVKKSRSFSSRLMINIAIIAVIFGAGAFAAHFVLLSLTRHDTRVDVPEFRGMIITEAGRTAALMDLEIIINDSLYAAEREGGMVLDQLPKAGVEVKPGRKIYVTINAFQAKMVDVPYVAGRSLRQAINMLEVAGLEVEGLEYRDDMATNYILEQLLDDRLMEQGDTLRAEMGSGIKLIVGRSQRAAEPRVPRLIGLTLADARRALWQGGFNLGEITRDEGVTRFNEDESLIYSQLIASNSIADFGSEVGFSLTTDRAMVDEILLSIEQAEAEAEKLRLELEQAEADSLAALRIMERATQREAEETDINFDNFFD